TTLDVRQLLRLIDWLMVLPAELQGQFRGEIYRFEEERRMPYLSSFERLAMEEGLEKGKIEGKIEGLLNGIEVVLEAKFGAAGLKLLPRARAWNSVEKLEAFLQKIRSASTLAEVRKGLR